MKRIQVTRILTKAEIDALNSTALTIVSAPKSTQIFVPRSIFVSKLTGNAASAGTADLQFVYTGDTEVIMAVFDADASGGVLGDNADRFVIADNVQTSATAGSNFPVVENALALGKGFDIKASAAITSAASTTVQVTVEGYIVDVR